MDKAGGLTFVSALSREEVTKKGVKQVYLVSAAQLGVCQPSLCTHVLYDYRQLCLTLGQFRDFLMLGGHPAGKQRLSLMVPFTVHVLCASLQ